MVASTSPVEVNLRDLGAQVLQQLGAEQTLEALSVDVADLRRMLQGELEFPVEVRERLLRVVSILGVGRATVALDELPLSPAAPVTAAPPATEATDWPPPPPARTSGSERIVDQLKADLYSARMIATRNLTDLRLRDDEILANQIVVYQIELMIIMDFKDTVPLPGLGWTELQMYEEAQRRLREMRAVDAALRRYDRGVKGVLRRWVDGKRQTPSEMLKEMLRDAEALHRAGTAERAESPAALLQRVLAPVGLDAAGVRQLLADNRD